MSFALQLNTAPPFSFCQVTSFQRAVRAEPGSACLWEGLGAAYQALGRQTAALKSFTRALELDPSRLYSLVQAAALNHQLGALTQAGELYLRAVQLKPGHPPALLGAAEAKLASAQVCMVSLLANVMA